LCCGLAFFSLGFIRCWQPTIEKTNACEQLFVFYPKHQKARFSQAAEGQYY